MEFICNNCNQEFKTSRSSEQYFCSRDCWWSYVRKFGMPKTKIIECKNCRELFEQKRRRQKFCNRECFEEYQENMDHGWRWSGGKPSCTVCSVEMSFYSKGESPICMSCRSNGHSPWGKDHQNFSGYATGGNQKERSETWKRKLLERDGFKCLECGFNRKECLQGAHIIPVSKDPNKAIDLENGLTLCANCHLLFDKGLIEFKYPYRSKNE